jgi:hypothetical protein
LNPADPANGRTLIIGGLLIVAAVVVKFFADYAAFWIKGNKTMLQKSSRIPAILP